ncbi:hypothetical protein APHAL10511_001261 [Amanita phalloides]|nr:hypothetical protein APHAL10511_001261 [Amanita phalloides]
MSEDDYPGQRHTRVQGMSKLLSIAANALCAGGLFTLPLLSPTLMSHLKLSQTQLTTVFLAGMVGQYPLAPVVGDTVDRHGPWVCSLLAAIFYVLSFGGFASQLSLADGTNHALLSPFRNLVFCSLLTGFGTVFSYYSALFAVSKMFPGYLGIASGASMALFGLSPLFLTSIASKFFTDESGNLGATSYMLFLAVLTGSVYLVGAFTLNGPTYGTNDRTTGQPITRTIDENSSLLSTTSDNLVLSGAHVPNQRFPWLDPSFWCLFLFCLCTLGAAEMVISNVGTIVLALPSKALPSHPTFSNVTARQVQLLSLSNTIIRLITGFVADFVSPVAVAAGGITVFPRKHLASRVVFLCCPSLLLALTFFWSSNAMRTQEDVWALSLGVGVSYGSIFTVLPSVVSAIWGLNDNRIHAPIAYVLDVVVGVSRSELAVRRLSYLLGWALSFGSGGKDDCEESILLPVHTLA